MKFNRNKVLHFDFNEADSSLLTQKEFIKIPFFPNSSVLKPLR